MASMTYLQLCQYTHRIMRAGNQQAGTYPLAIPPVGAQDQIVYDIIDTIPRAWEWLQNEHPSWNFMRKEGTLQLNNGVRTYSLSTIQSNNGTKDYYGIIPFWAYSDFAYFIIFDTNKVPEQDYIYPFVEYQEWRGFWDRAPRPTGFQPNRLTEWPDKTLELDPTPQLTPTGGLWTIRFDFRVQNQVLALTGEVPLLPPEFHECIAWIAVRMLCEMRMDSGPMYQAALAEIERYMARLKARYLPQIQVNSRYA